MSVTSLTEAKRHLNITDGVNDGELQSTLDRAEAMIAGRVGPLRQGSVTERVRGGSALRLTQPPVAALVSVTGPDGSGVLLDGLHVTRAGVVEGSWPAAYYDVTYTAGWAPAGQPLPGGLAAGILEMTHHLWVTQRGSRSRPGSSAQDRVAPTMPGSAYVWPFRVTEAIADFLQVGV